MKVAVLGAAGTIGPAIARDLAESDEVESLLLLDRDLESLETAAEALPQPCSLLRVDAHDGSLADALRDIDVLVNSASYRINLDAMRACLEAGCHYIDLGGLYWMTSRQLELSGQFERARLLALLGMGSAPGKTNLMARAATNGLAGVAEEIHVAAAGRDLDPPEGFSVPYALRTLLDELTMRPVVLRGGRPVEIDPLSAGGTVDFGEPIGPADTIHTLHSELRTFGGSFECGTISFRLSLSQDLLSRLRSLAAAPAEEIERAEAQVSAPSAETVSAHVVAASANGRTVRMRAVTQTHRRWGIGGGVISTAAPAAAAVRLLARGRVEARGAVPPERCLEPDEVFAELELRGCRFETSVTEGVPA
jgi:lysine 6-dehydrogenase